MIAIICSECKEGFLGLDENSCTFKDSEVIQSKQLYKLTPIGWSAMSFQDIIACPKCNTGSILKDIMQIWKEEKDTRRKSER